FGDRTQRRVVVRLRRAMCVREDRGVAEHAALRDDDREPSLERGRIRDVARLDRPLDAAGVGEGADGERRREPGHQAIEGRRVDSVWTTRPGAPRPPRAKRGGGGGGGWGAATNSERV